MMDKNGVNIIWAWAPQGKSEVEKNGIERERERERERETKPSEFVVFKPTFGLEFHSFYF
jgi:hypothetical protein